MRNKGFTLIELLAVITIMGILLLVAIPAVSRTIENSRRDTFATVSKEYLKAVRDAVLADNVQCPCGDVENGTAKMLSASACPKGDYYYVIDSSDKEATTDLLESGGKSPFGNTDIKGFVHWNKSTEGTEGTGESATITKEKVTYYILVRDDGKHGFEEEVDEENITRTHVKTGAGSNAELVSKDAGGQLNGKIVCGLK